MARPRKNPAQSVREIETEIAEEEQQQALLQRDLREALVAGENTRPYRKALADIASKIEHLQVKIGALQEEEEGRRYALTAATAEEITAEAVRRHAASLAPLAAPELSQIERTENVAF